LQGVKEEMVEALPSNNLDTLLEAEAQRLGWQRKHEQLAKEQTPQTTQPNMSPPATPPPQGDNTFVQFANNLMFQTNLAAEARELAAGLATPSAPVLQAVKQEVVEQIAKTDEPAPPVRADPSTQPPQEEEEVPEWG